MQRRFSAPARNSRTLPLQRRQKTKEGLHVKSASSETSVAILGLIAWMQPGGATLPGGRRFTRIYRGWKTITAWCCDAHFRAVDERTSIRLNICPIYKVQIFLASREVGTGRLVSQQDSQVAKIISGGAGNDGVAQRIKKRIGIEAGERVAHGFHTIGSGACPSKAAAIDHGAGDRTVAIDAVGAGA